VITLTLLHPVNFTPVQHWTFKEESVVKVGRATDNHVVLYSAVVSRYHIEVRRERSIWEIISLGANGTYSDGKRIMQVPIHDGMIVRLARSGPNIQVHLGVPAAIAVPASSDSTSKTVFETLVDDDHTQIGGYTGTGNTKTIVDPDSSGIRTTGLPGRQQIGKYQIVRRLGQGQTGMTYLANRDGQTVVLKTVNPERAKHPHAIALFDKQAQRLSQLSHPGLAQSRDLFQVEKQPYLVSEWIEGQTLFQHVVKRGKVEPRQAIVWALELCDILAYLHQQQPAMLHYDIRPENILRRSSLTASRDLALVDFGAIRVLEQELGSSYAAPERYELATPVSDLYAIGTTLAFLISGQEPNLFYRQREQGYRFYAEYVPGLSPELVSVIRKMTHPHPGDRYQSAYEVATALKSLG
jgi:Protein kinase domain/FHA domain